MGKEKLNTDRVTVFSDAVFAVVVTIMVLERRISRHSQLFGLCGPQPSTMR
jgi:uncharacterized membrane protein